MQNLIRGWDFITHFQQIIHMKNIVTGIQTNFFSDFWHGGLLLPGPPYPPQTTLNQKMIFYVPAETDLSIYAMIKNRGSPGNNKPPYQKLVNSIKKVACNPAIKI